MKKKNEALYGIITVCFALLIIAGFSVSKQDRIVSDSATTQSVNNTLTSKQPTTPGSCGTLTTLSQITFAKAQKAIKDKSPELCTTHAKFVDGKMYNKFVRVCYDPDKDLNSLCQIPLDV